MDDGERYATYANPVMAQMLAMVGMNPMFVKGVGCYLIDVDGDRYLDMVAGHGSMNLGHNPQSVRNAAIAALDSEPPQVYGVGISPYVGRLAERLAQSLDEPLRISFFVNSGSEAVEGAIKTARAATGRSKIIYCRNAYHGTTMGSLSMMAESSWRQPFEPLLPGFVPIPFNDVTALEQVLDGDVAAFVLEPVQSEGGIVVPDDGLAARPRHRSVARFIEDFSLGPNGTRALFTARGDVFTVPAEHGPTRNLTHSSSAHDKAARWSPDGRKIAFISDRSGEEELYLVDQDGRGEPERLTTGGDMMRYPPVWSPDGKYLAFADKSGRLWALEVATKRLTQVARDSSGSMRDQSWSRDGRWLAFSMAHASGFRSIYIWGVGDNAPHQVTGELSDSYEPVFDPEGKYLFFLSDREYAPQISALEWDFAANRSTGIFALALRRDMPPPFPPQSDEVKPDTAGAAAAPAPKSKERLALEKIVMFEKWEGRA